MTVVIVADFGFVEGGAAKIALDSVRLLHEAGFDVILFCGSEKVDSAIERLGIRIVKLGQHELRDDPNRLRAMMNGLWNPYAAAKLKYLLRTLDHRTTVVHVHSWTKILSPSVFSVLRKSRFRTFVTAHDYFLGCPNGAIYDYVRRRPCSYRGGSLRCLTCNCDVRNYVQKVWRWIRQRILIHQLCRFDWLSVVTVSDFAQRHLIEQIGKGHRCVRINNPTKFASYGRAANGNPDAFVYVGRMSAEKAPLLFAEAVTQCGVHGVMIGDGEMSDEVRGKYPSLEYMGWCDSAKVHEVLQRRAVALIFPSVLYETAGMTPLEAMACGVPCIISDGTAAVDYVEDGVTGLLFKCGDVVDLCDKIGRMKNRPFRCQLSQNIKECFDLSAYSEQTYVNRLRELYVNREQKG